MRGDFRDSVGIQFWKSARGVISPKAPGRTLSSELVELGGDARNSLKTSPPLAEKQGGTAFLTPLAQAC